MSLRLQIEINQADLHRTLRNFDEFPRRVRTKHVRIGLNAAAGVIKRTAAANTPVDTGNLRANMAIKVRIPDASFNAKHHGRPAYAVIGTKRRAGAYFLGGKRLSVGRALNAALAGSKPRLKRPARYAHLVEKGNNRGMMGRFPLSRAVQSHGLIAIAAMERKLAEGVKTEAAALAATR